MRLTGDAHHEARDVDDLAAHGDVTLADEDAGVVLAFRDVSFCHESLQATLHELLNSQSQHVIELALAVLEQAQAHHTADQRLTFENTSWVLLLEREKLTGSLSARVLSGESSG